MEIECTNGEQICVMQMDSEEEIRECYEKGIKFKWKDKRTFKIKGSEHFDMKGVSRRLTGVTDPIKSVVSGNGTSNVIAFQTYRVMVTAKDGTGANIGHGGDIFYIGIFNQCTPNSDFTWTEVSSARQVLSSPIVTKMSDNGDGTYYYDYSVLFDWKNYNFCIT